MVAYRRFVIVLLLSKAPFIVECAEKGNSLGVRDEPLSSTEFVEHSVPFTQYNDVSLVQSSVNGNKAIDFLVDTGASTNILDDEYAKAIGILPASEEYPSLQGHPMRNAEIDELRIGTYRAHNVRARLMNLASIFPEDCPAKGILGYPTFRRLELCIDYPKHRISFREGAYRRLEKSFDPVFTFVVVPVLIENQGPFKFILDTGSNMSLVEPHVLRELKPPKEAVPVVRISVEGPGGGFAWPRKSSRSDGITNAREFVRRACGVRLDGTLGWRHLRDYKVVVNYPTCTYQFEKIGYPPELKPVVVDVSPDCSRSIHSSVKEIVFEFSVPMVQVVSYFTSFECEHRWQDDRHLTLVIQEELKVDKEYEIILGHGFRSKKNVPLDWSPFRFTVVSNE